MSSSFLNFNTSDISQNKKTNKVGIVELKWNNTYLVKLKFW